MDHTNQRHRSRDLNRIEHCDTQEDGVAHLMPTFVARALSNEHFGTMLYVKIIKPRKMPRSNGLENHMFNKNA